MFAWPNITQVYAGCHQSGIINWVTPATLTVLRINALANHLGSSFAGCAWLHLAPIFPGDAPALAPSPFLHPNALFYLIMLGKR